MSKAGRKEIHSFLTKERKVKWKFQKYLSCQLTYEFVVVESQATQITSIEQNGTIDQRHVLEFADKLLLPAPLDVR